MSQSPDWLTKQWAVWGHKSTCSFSWCLLPARPVPWMGVGSIHVIGSWQPLSFTQQWGTTRLCVSFSSTHPNLRAREITKSAIWKQRKARHIGLSAQVCIVCNGQSWRNSRQFESEVCATDHFLPSCLPPCQKSPAGLYQLNLTFTFTVDRGLCPVQWTLISKLCFPSR